jgi:hypothetical protein
MDIQAAIRERLIGDAAFVALVGSYEEAPAVFCDAFPQGFTFGEAPAIIIDQPSQGENDDEFDGEIYTALARVRIYHKPASSGVPLVNARNRARRVLKEWPPQVIEGANYLDATVFGPERAPTTDPSLDGSFLSIRLTIRES